jgi:CubicO group peptidase (beta-lactamase class C family)
MSNLPLVRAEPETQGVSSAAVLKFVKGVDQNIQELHSLMLLRHGAVVAEGWWSPYAAERPHYLFSLTKSFTSTAVGMAVAEGHLTVDDPVLSFFSDQAPAKPDKNLKAMRVRHLLSMSTGHAEDTTGRMTTQKDWVKGFLALPVEHTPGAPFVYNSGASHMLSAIVQKVTGMKLVEYLQTRLFGPLGITKPKWDECPLGINIGGWGLSLKTEDIARFGQLYLQKGMWNGKQLLSPAWVEEATKKQVSNDNEQNIDWKQGYGYQFWRCRHGFYRGDGAFGQYCIVMPEKDAVLAITAGVDDMQSVLNLVWKHLLPAFAAEHLPADPARQKALSRKLTSLAHLPPAGSNLPAAAEKVTGSTFVFEPNAQKVKSIAFEFTEAGCTLTVQALRRKHQVQCGYGEWLAGKAPLLGRTSQYVFASGTWNEEETFVILLRFIETPFYHTLTCRFAGDQVKIEMAANVAFGPKEIAPLVGKRV